MKVEIAIKRENPHEEWADIDNIAAIALIGDKNNNTHPMFSRMHIDLAHKAALEDFFENLNTTMKERDLASLTASDRGPTVPLIPPRTIEDLPPARGHRIWIAGSVNLLAPIPLAVWRFWLNLSIKDVDTCTDHAINASAIQKDLIELVRAFPLSMYDHQKCSTLEVKVHTKQDLQTAPPRIAKHSISFWNCQRPYLRCSCNQFAKLGCKGFVMWLNHAIWFMINRLERFFDETYPSVSAKYVAFIIWLSGTMRQAIRLQIIFIHNREFMVEGALEFADNHTCKLLVVHGEGSRIRKIERLIKPAIWSVENPSTPSNAPIYKWARVNLNASPAFNGPHGRSYPSFSPRGRSGSSRGPRGRCSYNRNYIPTEYPNTSPIETFGFNTSHRWPDVSAMGSVDNSNPSSSNSLGSKWRLSPISGKILDWGN